MVRLRGAPVRQAVVRLARALAGGAVSSRAERIERLRRLLCVPIQTPAELAERIVDLELAAEALQAELEKARAEARTQKRFVEALRAELNRK